MPRLSQSTNRPVYKSGSLYLYHVLVDEELGIGRWFIGHDVDTNAGIGYVDSWSVVPHAVSKVTPLSRWFFSDDNEWIMDDDVHVECFDEYDTSVYLCSDESLLVCNFYFPITNVSSPTSLHVYRSVSELNLYRVTETSRWMVSHDSPGTNSGLAYIDCNVRTPNLIPIVCVGRKWRVIIDGVWADDVSFVHLIANQQHSVFEQVHSSWPSVHSDGDDMVVLNNGMRMPIIGLGTGGFTRDENSMVLPVAVNEGYRLVDSASEYHNEDIIGTLLHKGALRRQMVITTKVWPTRLGFLETLDSFLVSRRSLQSGYVDMFLLHWPECYEHISWMDCTEASNGTWQQSWRALEKLYCEGQVRAIGVSNFDVGRLQQLLNLASIAPQLLQNHMDPLHTDDQVLDVCARNDIVFQAYSVLRSVVRASGQYEKVWKTFKQIARSIQKDVAQVVLRWALQYGRERGAKMSIIPRTRTSLRLKTNRLADSDLWRLERHHMNAIHAATAPTHDEL